jgi:curved DNA-binding protein CbpA
VTPNPSETPLTPEEEAVLAEQVDLEDEVKRAVITTHRRLSRVDHYALLGVDRAADRKGVKRAYYELAGKFHPDKYFRKNLGGFKVRMEAIFARITLAHDTLSDRERRAEYDAYLADRRRSRSAEELMADALDEVRRVEQAVERELGTVQPAPTAPTPPPAGQVAVTLPPQAQVVTSALPPNVGMAARRDALARRLLGGPEATSNTPPTRDRASGPSHAPTAMSTSGAMDALRRRHDERMTKAKASEARKYVANAEAAAAANDVLAAANAYRVAVQLSPGDADLARTAAAAQTKADALLAETYTNQAEYEERNEQWPEASRSWSRVCKARPNDARAHERAGNALLASSGDLREAVRLAKRGCELEPAKAPFRVTLAKAYLAAGLGLAARRELETAAQLSPQDDTIRSMLKKL